MWDTGYFRGANHQIANGSKWISNLTYACICLNYAKQMSLWNLNKYHLLCTHLSNTQ